MVADIPQRARPDAATLGAERPLARLERTLLFQLVAQHTPALVDQMAAQGTPLPECVRRELEDYLCLANCSSCREL